LSAEGMPSRFDSRSTFVSVKRIPVPPTWIAARIYSRSMVPISMRCPQRAHPFLPGAHVSDGVTTGMTGSPALHVVTDRHSPCIIVNGSSDTSGRPARFHSGMQSTKPPFPPDHHCSTKPPSPLGQHCLTKPPFPLVTTA